MDFFLDNLSVLDLCVTSTIVPQLLANLRGPDKTVAFWGCVVQAYLFVLPSFVLPSKTKWQSQALAPARPQPSRQRPQGTALGGEGHGQAASPVLQAPPCSVATLGLHRGLRDSVGPPVTAAWGAARADGRQEVMAPSDPLSPQSGPAEAVEGENTSFPNTIFLVGFSDHPWLEMPLFGAFLLSYLLTLLGNGSIVLLSLLDPRLHTPMDFFLDNLSVLDLCVTSTIVPQLLANLRGPDKTVAFWGCVVQAYLFHWTGCTECALPAVMAYDRYVAICRPLRSTLLMPPRVCVQLAAVAWVSGLANALVQATLTFRLPHCAHGRLDHFFCEVPILIKLACGDTTANDLSLVVGALPFVLAAPGLVLVSYTLIARAVLRSPAGEGRSKALSTCSSHLAVVLMYFGPGIYMYLQPPARGAQTEFMSVFYCIVTPTLNPLIYTLRNKDVKRAWKRLLRAGPLS